VVHICGCIPARIRHALADLPETLDETYQRTLREINEADWEFAHRLFQFVSVASRPPRVEEVAQLSAIDFEAGPIPKFHEDWRLEDSVDAVLSTCATLLVIVDGGYPFGKVIQFSHFSVKEFLTSPRLAEASNVIPRRYHVSMTRAHTLVAQACLSILLHLHEDAVTSDCLEKWPLAGYAADHWADHAWFEDVSRNVEDAMKQLFDPSKPHLAVCVWIHDPGASWPTRCAEKPLSLTGTPLHYAALWGLPLIVEFLVIEHSQDVHSRGLENMRTPLHLASKHGKVKAARMLIEYGADVAAQDKDGFTPLHLVSQAEVASMLIEHGADVAAQDKDGETPLHLASRAIDVGVVRMLIEHGADVAAQDKDGKTPLHLASQENGVGVVRMLIEHGADVAAQDKDGFTPLHLAMQEEVARMLFERGADVKTQNKGGWNPLDLALSRGLVGLVRIYIEHGVGQIAQGKGKWTPLHRAPFLEYIDVAQILFHHGVDVTTQDRRGLTPLHLAAGGHAKLALVLLEHSATYAMPQYWLSDHVSLTYVILERDADADARDNDNCTPLHWASQQGHLEVVRVLLEYSVDADARDNDNCSPLHWASQQGYLEVVRVLVEHGVDVNAQDHSNWTPLHGASQNGHLEVVRYLLEHGADGCASDQGGWTSLQWPSYNGDSEIVRVLLDHGVDANTRDNSNWTPLHAASQQGHREVVQVLLEYGADANSRDDSNQTPLHLASRTGHLELVQLLESSANIHVRNDEGRTSSEEASVLEHGADANSRDDSGQTPLPPASRAGRLGLLQSCWRAAARIFLCRTTRVAPHSRERP
jgi:serine/threonine-protein phosphatase 6 regulatory ankyrin repeat subunit B